MYLCVDIYVIPTCVHESPSTSSCTEPSALTPDVTSWFCLQLPGRNHAPVSSRRAPAGVFHGIHQFLKWNYIISTCQD